LSFSLRTIITSTITTTTTSTKRRIQIANYKIENSAQADEVISKEVQDLLNTGRIRKVTHLRDDPRFARRILPVFAIRQGEKWRVVWDARALNEDIFLTPFKMETAATAARMLRPGDYLFTIDMWSGYHQLGLQDDLKKYCNFEWEGEIYEWQVLPFGLNVAPK
jgi:hypothetical protein